MGLADEIINGTYKNPYTQKKKKDEEVVNQNVENNNTSGIFKKSNAFDDGYQFGDVSKTIGSTLANAGTSIIKGMGNVAEGVSDFGTHVAAQIIDWAGNKEWADRTRKRAIEDDNAQLFNGIQKNFEGNSVLGETSNQILESVGYSTALMPFEFVSPHLGTAVMFTSATGSGLNEAYSQEGVTNTQAWIKGVGSGLIETATEKMFGLFGTSGLDTGIANTISSRITSGLGKSLVRMGVQGLGEAAEEGISYTANYILDRVIDNFSNGKGAKFSKEWNWEELGQQMGIAFVSASLIGMATNVAQVTQIATNEKINLKDAINEAGFRSDVKAQAEDLNNEIEGIKKKLRKNPNNSRLANELKSKYVQLNMLVMKNDFMQDNTINNSKNVENNNINTQTQRVMPMQNKMSQNQTSEQIQLPIRNYQYVETENTKINNLRQDMSKYWTDTNETKALGSVIEKIITDKGYNVRLDNTIKNQKGNSANAQITTLNNGEVEIRINPNAKNVGEFLLMHETTHAIGTQEIKDLVMDYASKNTEFNSALESLKETYGVQDVSDEVLADISGQLFENQEFINNLSMEKPNIFKRIYNKIIELANKITGNSNEALFVRDLANKWQEAYRTQNNTSNIANSGEMLYNTNERESDIYDTTRNYNTNNETEKIGTNESILPTSTSEVRANEIYEQNSREVEIDVKKYIKDNLGFKDAIINDIYNKISNNENITIDDIYNSFDDYREIYQDVDQDIIDTVKRIKNDLRNTRIDISSIKLEITDYNDFKKHNWGKLRLANNGIQIDSFYKELIETYPGYFDENIINPTEQLLALSEWRNIDAEELIRPTSYKLTNSDLENVANYMLNAMEYLNSIKNLNKSSFFNENNYSLPTKQWQQHLNDNYKATGTRTNLEDIKLPTKEYFENKSVKNEQKYIENIDLQPLQNNTVGEKINWNEIERPEGKFRKHYRSIIESSNTTLEAKKIAKEVMGQDTYIPDSNTKQLQKADERISMSGADVELKSMMSKTINNEKITAVDVAVGERLIEYYSKIGDAQKLQDAIQTTAMVGTQLGQAVQAMSILNHQTPQGQVVWIQRSIDKMNNELRQKRGENAPQFNLTDDMIEKILHSENEQQMNENLDVVYKELGQQVHKSTIEQLDSWRYFAMLGNFRTHIRNMTGNFLMGIAQDTKNKVAGAIEETVAKFVPNMERTQTVKIPSKEVVEFAKNDIQNILPQLEGNNKYNPKNALESNMRNFKSDALENTLGRMFNWNDNLLEAEDALGLKSGYKKALAQYITANDIDISNITDKQLAKARNYAIKQAQERTFHQANVIASAINSFTRKNKVTKAIGDAILPFVKTPANVAKTGIEYSPVGLSKTIVYDTVQLRKGNININQYIDNLSKGLTGSAITILGYALAQAGILRAGGSDDDKKEKFDEQSGKQAYSIQVGEKTYSIDWLAPVGIPLMVGAEIYEGLTQKQNENTAKASDDEEVLNKFLNKAEVLTNSLTTTLDPMVEMSMISGLVSSIKSFAQGDTQALSNMMTNMGKSYINQYVPTLLGQIAKTTDTVERDTTSTKSGTLSKAIDGTINQVKSKVPILRQTLPVRTDIWGEEQKLNGNWAMRFFEAGILPMNIKNVKNNKVVNELNELYDKTGESSILPTTINKKITIDGQNYRLTNQEYNRYKTMYGRNSYKLINELINSNNYNKMTDIEKQTAIEEIYTYVKEQNKIDYCKNNKLEYKESTLSKVVNRLNNEASNYFEYKALTKDMKKDKEKIDILEKSSYSDNTKKVIYENSIGEDDEIYSIMKKTNININEYLKYKQQNFSSDKKDDGTINGKSVPNSKKNKVVEYLNSMKITYNQRLLLYAMNGYTVTNTQKTQLANYVNSLKISKDEKLKLYNKFNGFTVYKDGSVTW